MNTDRKLRIRERAYYAWLSQGGHGDSDSLGIWLEAEADDLRDHPQGESDHPAPALAVGTTEKKDNQQDSARSLVREKWDHILSDSLEFSLRTSHEITSSDFVIDRLWVDFKAEDLKRLDAADHSYLCCRGHITPDLRRVLILRMSQELEQCPAVRGQDNQHLRGTRLVRLVTDEVNYRWGAILSAAESIFEHRGKDQFADRFAVRKRAIQAISDRCLDECIRFAQGVGRESEVRWHLKILAMLATGPEDRIQRDQIIDELRDGATRRYPYVPRYLARGKLPVVGRFSGDSGPNFTGFTAELRAVFPHGGAVKEALERYVGHSGVLAPLLASDTRPVPAEYASRFDELNMYDILTPGGIFAPKEVALQRHRTDYRRLPDGVVCAMSLSIMTEWVLRQALHAAGQPINSKWRGHDLLRRLQSCVSLRPETSSRLEVIFSGRSLNLRDVLAHGVFLADRTALLDPQLFGLSHALAALMGDLAGAHLLDKFVADRWDQDSRVEPIDEVTVAEQVKPGLTLLDNFGVIEGREHVSKQGCGAHIRSPWFLDEDTVSSAPG